MMPSCHYVMCLQVVSLHAQLQSEASAWAVRVEGMRGALEAKETHCAALEGELAGRPTQKQVCMGGGGVTLTC